MKSTVTLYQVCNSEPRPFNPVGAIVTSTKRDALAELRQMQTLDSNVSLAEAVYTRCPEQKKGW